MFFISFIRTGLSPEQLTAVRCAERGLRAVSSIPILPSHTSLCTKNNLTVIENHDHLTTSLLPRSEHWFWNQSKSRKTVTDTTGLVDMEFFKVNTRKTKAAMFEAPKCKVWVFNIRIHTNNEIKKIGVLWCEKGSCPTEVFEQPIIPHCTNIETTSPPHLSELAFLKPFVSHALAIEFGWI